MIDWKYFMDKYGPIETPHKFEEIALAYVQNVYPQYTWYPTGKTRDGNKDAQRKEVYFGEDDSFDVWEEAKFKGRGRTLRRQDIDPTILSGLIQGNVRLIVFVTNSRIPGELLDRAVLGARIKGMKVSCVLSDQLESWLILNPDIYRTYWDNHAIQRQAETKVLWIQNASFFDMVSNDFKSFSSRKVMLSGSIYLLTVSISSNAKMSAELFTTADFPFEIIEHPSYDDPGHLNIECGLNTFALLLKAKCAFSGGVNLRFKVNDIQYSRVTQEIEIIESSPVKIVYAQQLQLVNQIKSFIDSSPNITFGAVISLYAGSGMGKTFLLKSIYETFGLKRDMTIVSFESDKNALTNYLLLCRIMLFLHYGNIFWDRRPWSSKELEQHKSFAVQNNTRDLFDDASLSRLFDGCFDASIAKDAVEQLIKKRKKSHSFIHTKSAFAGKILLLDDFQYLNKLQADFIYRIIDDLDCYQSSCVVIISATKGRFPDQQAEARFLGLTPNAFELDGLTYDDMAETLGSCFQLSPKALYRAAVKILSPSPLLTCELLRTLKADMGNSSDDILHIIWTYSASRDQTQILKNRFTGLQGQYYLLDILYRFKKGIPKRILTSFDEFHSRPVKSDLELLFKRKLVAFQDELILPYHDHYVRSYIQLRKAKYFNALTGRFLSYLLNIPGYEKLFDADQILSMLIGCGKKYLRLYEDKIKERIHYYMQTTQFGAALHYCSSYYHLIKERKPDTYTREEFYYLFSYAYCLVHCGDQDLADQLLQMIYTFAKENVPEKYAAGSELLNQQFWSLKLDGVIRNSFLIQSGTTHMLHSGDLSGSDLSRVEQAYDVCFNRRMVTYLLTDEWEKGRATYAQRLKLLAEDFQGDEFRSRSATLIMDYARGTSFFAPRQAEHLFRAALEFFSCRAENYYRRILLCKIDLLLLKCVNGDAEAFWGMGPLIENLLQGGFHSEYFKAVLKRCACRTVFLSQTSLPLGIVLKADDIVGEISDALLESESHLGKRDRFLLNNLMAYYSICDGQHKKAAEYLQEVDLYVKEAGDSYRQIVAHNLRHINTISHIVWCTKDTPFDTDTFLLDCRFW